MDTISVWLVDDDPDIGEGLRAGLQHFPHIHLAKSFGEVRPVLKMIETDLRSPDILLLDLLLPDIKGIKAIPMFRKVAPNMKIIPVTGDDRSLSVYRSATLGVSGYLLKPLSTEDVVRACEAAMKGGIFLDAKVVPQLLNRLPAVKDPSIDYRLSPTEQHILPYIIQGFTDQEMAVTMNSSFHTIRNHVRRIHSKMRTSTRSELVSKIIREKLA